MRFRTTTNDWLSKIPVENPEVIREFILGFDKGHYMDLDERFYDE